MHIHIKYVLIIIIPQTQLDLGEMWLKQMGEAAQRYGITIQ